MTEAAKPLCFVIGPIGSAGSAVRRHADLLLNSVIRQVLEPEEFGYRVKRADEDTDPGMISDRMIADIIHADLLIADLTELNPNVFYELGIRHSAQKPAIHIARADTALPFDNVSHRTIFVDLTDWHSTEKCRNSLSEMVKTARHQDYQVSNPITQANASFRMRESGDPQQQMIARLQERLTLLEGKVANQSKIGGRAFLTSASRPAPDPPPDLGHLFITIDGSSTVLSFDQNSEVADFLKAAGSIAGKDVSQNQNLWRITDGSTRNRRVMRYADFETLTFRDLAVTSGSSFELQRSPD